MQINTQRDIAVLKPIIFFEGLDNEKTLKYSYFQYIGLMSDEIVLKGMYKPLINQIREKCLINNDEERELNELFTKKP